MSISHNFKRLKVKTCGCGQFATWSYATYLDGQSQGVDHYCDSCKIKLEEEIAAEPKPPYKSHGKNWSSLGEIGGDLKTSAPFTKVRSLRGIRAWRSHWRIKVR